MARAVIISHPSEVIRKGLLTIVENEVVSKIICVREFCDIKEHYFVTYSEIIFLVPLEEDHSEILNCIKTKTNRIFLIAIDSNCSNSLIEYCDFIFNINKPASELVQKIKSYFTKTDADAEDDELTIREKEVIRLIALGHTNKSIADTLFISTHTVISHRKNITDKLGIKSIPGLTVYAIIQKIISQDDIAKDQLS